MSGWRKVLVLLLVAAGVAAAGVAAAGEPSVSPSKCLVEWEAPVTNTDGSALTDLAEFRIYLAVNSNAFPSSPTAVVPAENPAPTAGTLYTWDCRNAGMVSGRYRLTVRAVDAAGNESANATPPEGVTWWTQASGLGFRMKTVPPGPPPRLRVK